VRGTAAQGRQRRPNDDIIVNKIGAAAKAGEHDADRLAAGVLNDLANEATLTFHSEGDLSRTARTGTAARDLAR